MSDRDPVRRHPDVTGHIIRAFAGMLEPWRILRDQPLEKFMEIPPGRGIRIFHEDKAAAGVSDKERQHPFRQAGAFQNPPGPSP